LRGLASFIFIAVIAGCAQCHGEQIVGSGIPHPNEAQITAATGQVSRIRDEEKWALSAGESVSELKALMTVETAMVSANWR